MRSRLAKIHGTPPFPHNLLQDALGFHQILDGSVAWNEHDDERERKKEEYRTKIQARIAEIERENAEREAAERAAAGPPSTRPRN